MKCSLHTISISLIVAFAGLASYKVVLGLKRLQFEMSVGPQVLEQIKRSKEFLDQYDKIPAKASSECTLKPEEISNIAGMPPKNM